LCAVYASMITPAVTCIILMCIRPSRILLGSFFSVYILVYRLQNHSLTLGVRIGGKGASVQEK